MNPLHLVHDRSALQESEETEDRLTSACPHGGKKVRIAAREASELFS
jgi:hypothetical protein